MSADAALLTSAFSPAFSDFVKLFPADK